jgi:hypothetical protein
MIREWAITEFGSVREWSDANRVAAALMELFTHSSSYQSGSLDICDAARMVGVWMNQGQPAIGTDRETAANIARLADQL